MPVTTGPAPTRAQALTLLRGFLLQVLPAGTEVVLGQANRVPEPTGDNFVCVIPHGLKRLSTTVVTWSNETSPFPTVQAYLQDVGLMMQLQAFGEGSTDNVNIITTLLRSPYGVEFFAGSGIVPLWCDDGQQIPFISAEDQYADRWIVEALLQMNISLTVPQQFATSADVGIFNVDATWPPT